MQLCALFFLVTIASAEETPAAVSQKLFNAMKAHDATAAAALFSPGATLTSVTDSAKTTTITATEFVEHVRTSKKDWDERMRNPTVLIHGNLAVVWAEYEFRLDGKFSHCGVDAFTLVKVSTTWKIAAITNTRESPPCLHGTVP